MGLWSDDTLQSSNTEYKPLPEGDYDVMIDNVVLDGATPAITDKIKITYSIPNTKRLLFQNFTFNERTGKFLNWQLSALGVDMGEVNMETTFEDAASKAASTLFKYVNSNVVINVNITHREYNGKTYNNVIVNEVMGKVKPRPNPLDDETSSEQTSLPNHAPTFDVNEKMPWD